MNLLPNEQKFLLKEGLKRRLLIVTLLLVSFSFLAGTALLLPSYFLTKSYLDASEINISVKGEEVFAETLNLPAEINSKLKLFQTNTDGIKVVDSFSKIIASMPKGVTLSSISFTGERAYKGKQATSIMVSGVAADRESLMLFSSNLTKSGEFSSVDIPVSNLTKNKNLPFSVDILIY